VGAGEGSDSGSSPGPKPGALTALLRAIAAAPEEAQGGAWEALLRAGRVVGRFELVREVGRGGFGVVWEARDRELGRSVAFKAVRTGARTTVREERLFREAETAARLQHPNIVTLHDMGRAEQGLYLILELLKGRTLAERRARGSLPLREALRIGVEVAKGVAHAHAHGVVHRDLTPGNVFLCEDGQVKVLDFGMAHAFGQRKVDGGTRAYMAPEQAREAPEDERTDVFALGVILHEMLSGERPFPDAGAQASSSPPRELEVPQAPAVGELVGRMLAEDPVKRPRDGSEVLSALTALQAELERPPSTGSATVRTRRPSLRLRHLYAELRRRRVVRALVLVGIGAVAAAPGLGWYLLRGGSRASAGRGTVATSPVARPANEAAPSSQRWHVPVGTSPVRGPADALVTLVEFADFQCPYTKQAEPLLMRLQARYPDTLRVVWKDYPLSAHPDAVAAAHLAREALRQQGLAGFWQAHGRLLAMSPRVGRAELEALARTLGLDLEEARKAIATERYRDAVDADVDTLARIGMSGTPTFFVNGRMVEGEGEEELERAVADAVGEARGAVASGAPRDRLYDELQKGARAAGEPRPRVVLPDPGRRPARGGPADRAIAVHEFCDLSLARCAWSEPVLRETLQGYGDEVRLVWWDVGDPQRPEARRARLAALAADVTPGGFWRMHDAILADLRTDDFRPPPPEKLGLSALREHARRLGIDLATFDYAMASDNETPAQREEVERARGLGLRPGTLVIDGEVHSGFEPPLLWRRAIDRALARRK
jgi:protein-disulfide isomerase